MLGGFGPALSRDGRWLAFYRGGQVYVLSIRTNPAPVASAGLATDGCFDREGTFYRLPSWVDMPRLTELFRHKVLPSLRSIEDWKLESANLRFPISNLQFSIRPRRGRMLLSKGKITEALVENLLSWPHSGFHIHQSLPRTGSGGERIEADDRAGRERVAAYILRAPLSRERMTYREETGEGIVLSGKKGRDKRVLSFRC